jgi:putative lipoprotein
MAGSRIVLVSNYGASRLEVPLPVPTMDKEAHTTRWDAGELVLEVSGRPCRDSMSGEKFESTVVITTRMETLHGCGRALH